MPKPTILKWIEIDLSAVEQNLSTVRRLLSPGVKLVGIVKADAYGHGAVEIGKLLSSLGVETLGTLTVDEALILRRAGISSRIWVLSPPLPEQAEEVVRAGLTPTLDGPELADALAAAVSSRRGKTLGVNVDADFGLGRWGLPPSELGSFLARLGKARGLRLEGLSTDLGYVPGRNAVEAEEKLRAFQRLCRRLVGGRPALRHAANSGVLLDFPHWQFDAVRIGNLLYGINPTSHPLSLANPWRMVARVISVRTIPKGRPIGYGSEYLAPRRMTIATLPAGYSDGLTMEPAERLIKLGGSNRYWGLLRGHQVPFVGRCGIAHVLVDATTVPNVRVGEEVTVPVRRTAASARLPRVYKVRR